MPPADVLSSLVPIRISVAEPETTDERVERCQRRLEYFMLNTATGQTGPARCLANSCVYCGPVNARLVGGAITLAKPERMLTLTLAGNDWQAIRGRMKLLTHRLRRSVGPFQWCWHVEPNPKGTGHHVHAWQRGSYIPQRLLSTACRSEGMGRVCDVRRWKPSGRAVTYGVKLAGVGYGLKLAEATATLERYLECNGGRLVHASRGFWLDRDGQPVGQREAMDAWGKRAEESGKGEWQLVRRSVVGIAG